MKRALLALALAAALGIGVGACDELGAGGPGTDRPGSGRPGTPSDPRGVPVPTEFLVHKADPPSGLWPGPFLVRGDSLEITLGPSTYCYREGEHGICADGFDLNPPTIRTDGDVFVYVPVADFTDLQVFLTQLDPADDKPCGEGVPLLATALEASWWQVPNSGTGGRYTLSLFASGENLGDMIADVIWHVPDDSGEVPGCPA